MTNAYYNKVGHPHRNLDEDDVKYKKLRKTPHDSRLHINFNKNYNGRRYTETSHHGHASTKNEKESQGVDKIHKEKSQEDNKIIIIISVIVVLILTGVLAYHVSTK